MPKHRDLLLAGGATAAVLVVLALGFIQLGPREKQRAIRADERRVRDLQSIVQTIYARQNALPASLAELPRSSVPSLRDPVTQAPYEYHPQSGMRHELCAGFATNSAANEGFQRDPPFWSHPRGRHCFQLDGSRMAIF
ncbi:MAG TPA: hypothetical protein VN924_04570 [Bryobacteraceae bacterium]|nr:hypothetical protein [Bryobacteraceae bacterium]